MPVILTTNGFGGSYKDQLAFARYFAARGYAVLTYTARGFWGSCGTPDARLAGGAACAAGYLHLADHRYEVRDTQELIAQLVDEGVVDSERIGVTGDSYGGGQSLMLAALRDRVMLPKLDEVKAKVRDDVLRQKAIDTARAAESTGSGLGLSITKAIVERHGGTIRVTSPPGHTTFTIVLPQPAVAR